MPVARTRQLPRELTDDEFAALDLAQTRCTGCTPCCTGHAHFLYRGKVVWACQTKLKRHCAHHRGEGEAR